jgi:hypothetical protein
MLGRAFVAVVAGLLVAAAPAAAASQKVGATASARCATSWTARR